MTSRRTALPSRVTPPRFFRVHKTPRARRCVRLQRSQCWTQSAACCSAIATAPYRGPPHSARPRRCRLRDAHACAVRRIFRQLLIGSNDVARRLPSRSYRTAAVADRRRPSPTVAATLVSHHHHPHHRQFYWRHTHGVIATDYGVCVCGVRRPGWCDVHSKVIVILTKWYFNPKPAGFDLPRTLFSFPRCRRAAREFTVARMRTTETINLNRRRRRLTCTHNKMLNTRLLGARPPAGVAHPPPATAHRPRTHTTPRLIGQPAPVASKAVS